jgi:transposase InsO family protein
MADNTTALGKIASRRLRAVRWFVCAAAIGPACRRVATFKTELVDGRRFPGYEHAEHEILHWIGFYNDERLHEELGDFDARRIRGLNIQDRQRPNPG